MRKKILVAPLNWGLGHATRCIPIINSLILNSFEPIIASDGGALSLLTKEFPDLIAVELPPYNIEYSKKGKNFKLKLLKDSPRLIKTIKAERIATEKIIESYNIAGVISDNRFGVYSKKVPSVFMTHQLNVLSGNTTWISTKLHNQIIKKYNECWVPDNRGDRNLSGKLSHRETYINNIKYIGPLSRFKKQNLEIVTDILVLLSGPEPQRTLLEEKLLNAFDNYNGKIVFVRGVIEKELHVSKIGNLTIYNFMTSELLEKALNESKLIVSRSGYTTIMDLAKLEKNAFFIPTPGQYEQEYLAQRLTELGYIASCNQDDFTLEHLKEATNFKGLENFDYEVNFKSLFRLF